MKKRAFNLVRLEKDLGYEFKDPELLNQIFIHSSYVNENKWIKEDNERLEFLGDSVINFVVTDFLYSKLNKNQEGDLTKLRASIICESSFAEAGRMLNLESFLLLGRGEELSGGRERDSIIADTFEALWGALYLDGGFDKTQEIILDKFKSWIESKIRTNVESTSDYKTWLQEELQKRNDQRIKYKLSRSEGPDHDKTFFIDVYSGDQVLGSGVGKNKKSAEQAAAKQALVRIGILNG